MLICWMSMPIKAHSIDLTILTLSTIFADIVDSKRYSKSRKTLSKVCFIITVLNLLVACMFFNDCKLE